MKPAVVRSFAGMAVWRHEPLLHFIVLGAILFGLYAFGSKEVNSQQHIIITSTAIERLRENWKQDNGSYPDNAILHDLIEAYVREEVLYRQAMAQGLEEDDVIVRRRLIQKFDFMLGNLTQLEMPGEAQLQAYYESHKQDYRRPELVSFSHIYFNSDHRKESAEDLAEKLLPDLKTDKATFAQLNAYGDPFILQHQYSNQTQEQISRLFGKDFASVVILHKSGQWFGPVLSGYGVHLVLINHITLPTVPALSEIRDTVTRDYLAQQRAQLKDAAYQRVRSQYLVEIKNQVVAVGN